MSKPDVVVTCPKACLDEKRRMREALETIYRYIFESDDLWGDIEALERIKEEAMKGLGE